LCWLSISCLKNENSAKLISVEDIVKAHWKEYGRNYYQRYDYENLSTYKADMVFDRLKSEMNEFIKEAEGNTPVNFSYTDPVDHSISPNWRLYFQVC
jgi:phosphoglucomutase